MVSRSKNGGAFTLLELLVVTIIIGVLLAVMVPALGAARQRAGRIACGQTLHGLGIGLRAYLSEHGERFPVSAQMPSVNTGCEPLPRTLASQVTAARAFRCPADNEGYVRPGDHRSFPSYFAGEGLSYDYNMTLGGRRIERALLYDLFHDTATYLLQDFDNFHDSRLPNCRNLLYADYHVGTVDDILGALNVSPGTASATLPAH
jgi:prepilin-type N-terminal cleavage/methylation domain-containing protein